jgi:hypothetical protein
MKKAFNLASILIFITILAQSQDIVPLFRSKEPLRLQASGSVKAIKKNTNDSTLVTRKFQYENSPGNWTDITTDARVRGNYRLNNCYFPPLKLKFKKKDVQSTIFEGTKALKLVVPCLTSKDKNVLVRKEYLCYQFYELLSPFHFKTRLASFKLTEVSKKSPREFDLLTFMVEDNSQVAKRANGKIMEVRGLTPARFEEKQSVRNDFFQYMIGNADWSAIYQHNANVMYADGKYITLSYDFDMAGFVNAGYSHTNAPQLGTGDPRERVYRGFCKSKPAMEEIRKEFLAKEASIHSLIDQETISFTENDLFSERDLKDMHGYLDQFFDILKNDRQFEVAILGGCRTEQ